MQNSDVEALISGLFAKNTHIEPKKALEGLTPANARQKPNNNVHSCWENLHHIVIWQEGLIDAIKGKKVDWKEIEKHHNWPTETQLSNDSNFDNLVKKYLDGLVRIEKLLRTINLNTPMPAWGEKPIINAVIVLLQHNSYHLGKIMALRKIVENESK
jgi:uncharacterized damage-inducible protein DinB